MTRKTRENLGNRILRETLVGRDILWRTNSIAFQERQVEAAIDSGNFHEAFIPLKIIRDYYRGISTTYESDEASGHNVLVRDARAQLDQNGQPLKYQCEANYYKYVQLSFNYFGAIIDLLEIENDRREKAGETDFIDIEAAKEDLKGYARAYLNDIIPKQCETPEEQQKENEEAERRADFKFGRFFHDVVLPFYAQYRPEGLSEDAIKSELKLGRNFANIKVDPYVVATLSRHSVATPLQRRTKHDDHIDIVELELPMTELTEGQKKLYVDRAQLDWFRGQSDLAQALIDRYAERVLGGAMIPAQLIYHLIGTRNGYEKWTVVLDAYDETSGKLQPFKIINTAHHAGSQAHLLKLPKLAEEKERVERARQSAVDSTIDQLHQLTDATDLTVNTLVTPLGINQDAKVKRQIEMATRQQEDYHGYVLLSEQEGDDDDLLVEETYRTHFANLSLNTGRRLGVRKLDGIEMLHAAAELFLGERPSNRLSYLEHMQLYIKHRDSTDPDFVLEQPPLEVIELYNAFVRLNNALDNNSTLFDPENHNLEISTEANLLVDSLNKAQSDTHYVLVSGCFSGQDRGGMLSTNTTNEAIHQHLTNNNPIRSRVIPEGATKVVHKYQRGFIQDRQAMAGHTQEMAGNAGTGWGGEGVKKGSADVIPDKYPTRAKKALLSETGKYNEHSPKNPSRPFYKKKSFWIGVGLVVLGLGLAATGVLSLKGGILVGAGAVKIAATCFPAAAASFFGSIANYFRARKKRLEKFEYDKPQRHTTKRRPKPVVKSGLDVTARQQVDLKQADSVRNTADRFTDMGVSPPTEIIETTETWGRGWEQQSDRRSSNALRTGASLLGGSRQGRQEQQDDEKHTTTVPAFGAKNHD